jgi:hypothetical protein
LPEEAFCATEDVCTGNAVCCSVEVDCFGQKMKAHATRSKRKAAPVMANNLLEPLVAGRGSVPAAASEEFAASAGWRRLLSGNRWLEDEVLCCDGDGALTAGELNPSVHAVARRESKVEGRGRAVAETIRDDVALARVGSAAS